MLNTKKSTEEIIAAEGSNREREYWIKKLSGHLEKITFPYDFQWKKQEKNQQDRSSATGSIPFKITGELFEKLVWIINESDARLHMILMAGVVILLDKYNYHRTNEIIVGTTIYRQDIEGDFINTVLALKCPMEERMSFKELLYQVKQTVEEAVEHQNYSLETLLYEYNKSSLSREDDFPLFDTAVLVESIHDRKYLQHIPVSTLFSFLRTDRAIEGRIEYNSLRYEGSTIRRMTDHFLYLMQEVIFNVDQPLGSVNLISEEKKGQLLFDFNRTGHEFPADGTMHGLCQQQAVKTPDKVVLVFEDMQITYEMLNEQADTFADCLMAAGLGPGILAALMVKRSIEMIVGILSILKAGGAYLPIDLEYPRERINYILADSQAGVLVRGSSLSIEGNIPVVVDIPDRPALSAEKGSRSSKPGSPTDPAYVIYTSGTTGRPKGAVVEHQSAVNTLVCRKEAYAMIPGDSSLQFFSYSFDGFVTSFFTPIISGARVVLLSEAGVKDIVKIKQALVNSQVTHFISVPPLYRAMLEALNPTELSSLKIITLAGDKVTHDLLETTRQRNKNIEIVNEYGVTEAAVMSTIYRHQESKEKISIGQPVWNTRLFILDKQDQPKPVGIFGELCIAGIGVSRGYLNNPELTCEKFKIRTTPNKKLLPGVQGGGFLEKSPPGRRRQKIYKTGDLARWLVDGNIEFAGRIDHQVKIRGFRIELSEIENQLLQLDHIKEAVVIVHTRTSPGGESNGDPYICAYVNTKAGQEPDTRELTRLLTKNLPDYMIPSFFIKVDKIPLTPNGKIDYPALPKPQSKSDHHYMAPGDELERQLVEIWARVLQLDEGSIGIDDNFFDLGGHSLKVAVLISKIQKVFNVDVPMVEMFKMSTIRGLANYIREAGECRFIPIEPGEKKEYYPLSPAQKRMYILQQMDLQTIGYNIPLVVALEGNIDKDKLENTFIKLIHRHESLRTIYRMINEDAVQQIVSSPEFSLQYHQAVKDEVGEIVNDFVKPFDLSAAPQLRVGLINIDENKYILMTDIHHINCDGSSNKILMREFFTLYNGETLLPMKLQYRDYAVWLKSEKQLMVIKKQEEYWLRRYKGQLPVLNLPLDFPRPEIQSFEGQSIPFEIEREATQMLNQIARSRNATMFMVLLAVYNVLLSKLCGQEDIIVGTTLTGRRHEDQENIVGMFVATLPLRNKPSGEKTFMEFLSEIKENTLDVFDNQDYPFEELVQRVSTGRDSGHNPVFDVMFDFHGFHESSKVATGSDSSYQSNLYDIERRISKFDLILTGRESNGKLLMSFEFSTKLFKNETIQRFIDYFKELISYLGENRYVKLEDIRMHCQLEEVTVEVQEYEGDFGF